MSDMLSTGTSALIAFRRALTTVGHNVANVNTPGYSRQRVELEARTPQDIGVGYIGRGTQISDVRRVVDDLATARLIDSGGELARLQQLSSLSNRVDSLMSDPATGISGLWSGFFDSVSALSANAAAPAQRQNVLGQANALASRFQQMQGQFDQLSREVNDGLLTAANEVNRLAGEIASLNARIGNGNHVAPDLLDKRELLVTELVAYTGGTAVHQDGSSINVLTAGGQALVVGAQAARLTTVADPYRPERVTLALDAPGGPMRLDERVLGGRVGGMLEFRSQVLDPAQAELGRIALGLGSSFNAGHAQGMDLYGALGGDFFSLPAPAVSPHAGNGGSATFSAAVEDLGAVDGRNLVLTWNGGGWTAADAGTGALLPMSGSGAAGDPLRVAGMALEVAGTPATGDRFLLQPTAQAAAGFSVAITDPSRIAAANPLAAGAELDNLGTGRPSAVTVTDAGDPGLLVPATIEFLDADQYTVNGAGPHAYTPGGTISGDGWSFSLDGIPAAGDRFSVVPAGADSSDNGNATRLAGHDDLALLNGGSLSLNGAIAGLTTTVGSAARHAEYAAGAQSVLHDQAVATRDSVAGVNLDEEAANMLQLQQAYQAAAQIIATADTLFQSLLGAVRR